MASHRSFKMFTFHIHLFQHTIDCGTNTELLLIFPICIQTCFLYLQLEYHENAYVRNELRCRHRLHESMNIGRVVTTGTSYHIDRSRRKMGKVYVIGFWLPPLQRRRQ